MTSVMYNVEDVINYILCRYSITNKKLQKILYYAYSWTIALMNDDADHIELRLFEERPQAWAHGPAFHNVYKEYKKYGWEEIPKIQENNRIAGDAADILNKVLNVYMKYSADDLEGMTHQEDPWIKARAGLDTFDSSSNIIGDRDIFVFYNDLYQKNDKKRRKEKQKTDSVVSEFSS